MRAVVQRVTSARVVVSERVVGAIDSGLLVLLGVSIDDDASDAEWMTEKLMNLRIFSDDDGKMNRSVVEAGGGALVVSQFTLYGDVRKGRRPSFVRAAAGEGAERLYEDVVARLRAAGLTTETGEFGAMMQVESINDGPVTLLLDSNKTF